jgi:hypothetical protein
MRTIRIGGLLLAGFLIATAVRSQAPERTGTAWEYATVTASPDQSGSKETFGNWKAEARICYGTPGGCRYEVASITTREPNFDRDALMAAASKLGADGWELTAATDVHENNWSQRVMYFRRPRR